MAERVSPVIASGAIACVHCGNPIVMSGWDNFNGFLVECPHCHGFHGRRWSIRAVTAVGFVLNALSFLFTMRPGRALLVIVIWCAAVWLVMPRINPWPDWAQATAFGTVILGPAIINAVLLVRHQIDLDRHPVAARSL
jgi:hypothetical protein